VKTPLWVDDFRDILRGMKTWLRYFWTAALLVGFGLRAISQWRVGLEAGPDLNFLKTNISNVPVAQYNPVIGIQAGLIVQYSFNKWLALEAQPCFQQKGYKLEWTGYYSGIYQTNLNGYWSLPLIGDISFMAGKFRLTAQLGVYGAYWGLGRAKGVMPNVVDPTAATTYVDYIGYNTLYSYNVADSFNKHTDQRIELGWMVGERIAYCHKNAQFFVGIQYYYSSTDQEKNYEISQIPRYNQTFVLSAGILYTLKAIKWWRQAPNIR
jgi:hypothetical protein